MPKQGYISCSQLSKIMVAADLKKSTPDNQVFGDGAQTYAQQLAAERIGVTDFPEAFGRAIDWGNEQEWAANERYKEVKMCDVERPMFIEHPTLPMFGGTPDGLVGLRGGVEYKCPDNPVNHLKNIRSAEQFETTYKPQVQGYLLLTNREWWDAVSFDPRYPERLQIAIKRYRVDENYRAVLIDRIKAFNDLVESIVNECNESKFLV